MKHALLSGVAIFSTAMCCAQTAGPMPAAAQQTLINQYCAGCHNDKLKSGGFAITKVDVTHPGQSAEPLEKMVRKLRAGMMPPAGARRPDEATIKAFAAGLEQGIDQAAASKPYPGRPALHRLNRSEYANSVRDLLALDIDPAAYLPTDDMSHGFDNMAEVLNISPTLMDGYLRAAGKISRLAIGDRTMKPLVETYHVSDEFSQTKHVEGTPFGTRGGTVFEHTFPADGEYFFKMTFYYANIGTLFGSVARGEQIEVAIDGERAALLDVDPKLPVTGDVRSGRIKVTAGRHMVSASFLNKAAGPVDDFVMPFERSLADLSIGSVPGLTGLPHLRDIGINGPYNISGVSDNPSRRKIFVCRPVAGSDELPCAKKIIAALARQAFRRPVSDSDLEDLLGFYQKGRNDGDFESGIRMTVQMILADPEFVFRFERTPAGVAPGTSYRISDLELASRLSFFLWSSPPDEQLIAVATQGKLKDPAVLERQVRRMMADPRSEALATNFAGQWLYLRNLKDFKPDVYEFPNFDENLLNSMRRETELFFDSFVREDRSLPEMLTANHTFVDERLAIHYGIPGIVGNKFRRVAITDDNRRGLLGQGSYLAATSLANRTSPVQRGKWILENVLGTVAPTPPPNVPPLKENEKGGAAKSVREQMEEHRTNEPCHSCHQIMDPLGFSLENFDAIGQWRVNDSGFHIDPSGTLVDGTKVGGAADLRQWLVKHSDAFIRTFTNKLLTYALGRGTEYYDMPVVRAIDRDAERNNYRISSFILGIVKSAPFQMRTAEESKSEPARETVARR